eukprot:GFYU01005333.1.p1 GENE.GFYU01005333.1~~GFYU01005333.1.p1  ORF type:complete len:198 (-),score=57.93 GFYU01005333.1:222-770(-)
MSDNEDFFQAPSDNLAPSAGQRVLFFLSAVYTAALPAFLYVTVKEVPLTQDLYPIFGVVTFVNALGLMFAYEQLAYKLAFNFSRERDGKVTLAGVKRDLGNDARGAREILSARLAHQEFITNLEVISKTLLHHNVFFLGCSLFLGFYFLRSLLQDLIVNYAVSVTISTAFLAYVSFKTSHSN